MPELPDVEALARRLRQRILRRRITRVALPDPSVVRSPRPSVFGRRLRGRSIRDVGRRGKYFLVHLSGGLVIVGHLRMTGDIAVVRRTDPLRPHTRLMIGFDGDELRFVDQRRFGHVELVGARALDTVSGLRRLGVEPLDPAFTPARLRALLRGRRGALKALLLRQDLIAGIGNIFADEILYQARLHPARQIRTLRPLEIGAFYRSIRRVLRRAVRALSRRRGAEGTLLAVRAPGGVCPRCGGPLRVARIAGRTTYFCPRCQR